LERYWLNCYSEFELVAQTDPLRLIGGWSLLPKATALSREECLIAALEQRVVIGDMLNGKLKAHCENFSTGLPIGISLAPWFAEELAGLWRWLSLSRMGGMPAQCG